MLQIIRGKLVIFLITLCLFVVYLGFDNNSNSDIVFYGHKTPKSVEIYLSEKNIIYKIINDQKISRGNGHFISIMVNNYRTHCGVVDINLNFFNDILYSVRLKTLVNWRIWSSALKNNGCILVIKTRRLVIK
ncbi:dCTP deaminase [Escherichia coli]|nr:dCTP deaminase [Escherichia coli]